jgi:hypothetical protein
MPPNHRHYGFQPSLVCPQTWGRRMRLRGWRRPGVEINPDAKLPGIFLARNETESARQLRSQARSALVGQLWLVGRPSRITLPSFAPTSSPRPPISDRPDNINNNLLSMSSHAITTVRFYSVVIQAVPPSSYSCQLARYLPVLVMPRQAMQTGAHR